MFINRLAFGSFKSGLEDNLRRAVESMENVVKNNFGEDDEDDGTNHHRQLQVYKQLLVEMELGQLKVLREYQKLFAEKEARIADLTAKNPLLADNGARDAGKGGSPDDCDEKTREEEAKEDTEWMKDWEAQMKTNISEKMDALVQAREHQDTARVLQDQLDALKTHVRAQDAKVDQLERLEELRKSKEEGDESALDSLALEYSKLSQESEEAHQRATDLARERDDLVKQSERLREQLQILVQTGSNAVQGEGADSDLLASRDEEIASLRAKLADAEAVSQQVDKDRQTALQTAERALETRVAEAEALRTEAAALRESEASLEARLEIAQASSSDSHDEELEQLRSMLEAKAAEVAVLETENGALRKSESELKQSLQVVQDSQAELATAHQKEVASVQGSLEAKEQEVAALQTKLQADVKNLETQLQAAHDREDAARTQTQELEADLSSLRESKAAVDAALEAESSTLRETKLGLEAKISALRESESALEEKDSILRETSSALEEKSSALREAESALAEARVSHESAMEAVQAKLQQTVQQLKESSAALSELEKLKEEMEQEHAAEREEAAKIRAEIEDTFHSTVERLEAEMERREQESLAELARFKENFEARLSTAEHERDEALIATVEIRKEAEAEKAAALAALEDELMGQVDEYRQRYIRESALRKRVHNELMDLKGNIRVYCRVRPVLAMERKRSSEDAMDVTSFPMDNEIEVARDEATSNRFEFDSVFAPSSTQEQVFEDISPLVTSTLDGYDVCIFAYGQTGSGKTFTMEGSREDPGVNLRALHRLFQLRHDRREEESFAFTVSILEIYNESVRDLLARSDAGAGPRAKLDLRVASNGAVFVQDLQSVEVGTVEDVQAVMRQAQGNRAVGAHSMNEHSSRSHLVFMLNIEGRNLITGAKTRSKLNLIDLAGSERVSKTDASGDRLKEAQNINKSLSALGDVIAALGDPKARQQHVPYRNSKLTHLLQNSLGGGSKVAMFVNISPVRLNAPESVCSLNFAARCRKVQLGQAKRKGDSAELKKYKRIVDDLRAQLGTQTRSLGASTSSLSSLTGSTAGTPRKPRKISAPASASK